MPNKSLGGTALVDSDGYFYTTLGKKTNFHVREFVCKCGECNYRDMSNWLIDKLQDIRDMIDAPVTITSGIRCEKYNDKVRGARHSMHLADVNGVGHAADILTKSMDPVRLFMVVSKIFPIKDGGRGLYHSWVHIDDREGRMEWVKDEAGPYAVHDYIARVVKSTL